LEREREKGYKMSNQVYKIKAKIQREGVKNHWIDVGIAMGITGGRIIMTLEALPLHSNGVMMLYPVDKLDYSLKDVENDLNDVLNSSDSSY